MVAASSPLDLVDDHWAVEAIGDLGPVRETSTLWLAAEAVGTELNLSQDRPEHLVRLLERASGAFEIAAIEGLNALIYPAESTVALSEQAQAAAHRVFDLQRVLPVPGSPAEQIFHVLHLAAVGYCGDRWPDVRRWLIEHAIQGHPREEAEGWPDRVLWAIGDCWLRLFRMSGWEDLSAIPTLITALRAEQGEYEALSLAGDDPQGVAFRLVALYHWAKASEVLALFMLQGSHTDVRAELDRHFESAMDSATNEPDLFLLLKWLQAAARMMVRGSMWSLAQDSQGRDFIQGLGKTRGMFELLPPQRAAFLEQGLLDAVSPAVVVDLPTSGGKTILAEFKILQALNQFQVDRGWVAYIAPTRALVGQVARRLRADFGPIGVRVEQLTGAVELDSFEEDLLSDESDEYFQVLVSTPEKLGFVVRNKSVGRPLALVVMDEAQSIEDLQRGLRIELLLATIKSDSPSTHFLLLTPFVPNSADLARWLSPSGKSISLGTSPWQPNERIVGIFDVVADGRAPAGWSLTLDPVQAPRSLPLSGRMSVGGVRPLNLPYSGVSDSWSRQTGAMASVFSARGTSIAVARRISDVWSLARLVASNMDTRLHIPEEVALVQRFLATEVGPNYELIDLLSHGVGVHHGGLSDEARALIEWLGEEGRLRVICATTTLVHGINFPVASVFLASRYYPTPDGRQLSSRTFWNLAGRAGRADQGSVGVVGLCAAGNPEEARRFLDDKIDDLASRLVSMLDELEQQGRLNQLATVIHEDQWSDFRSFVAHLVADRAGRSDPVGETEQLLRNTFGYGVLRQQGEQGASKARALLNVTRDYAASLVRDRGSAGLADSTGFSPEGVRAVMGGMRGLGRAPSAADWSPNNLFGASGLHFLSQVIGVMMRVPAIRESLREEFGGDAFSGTKIAEVAQAWVNGESMTVIAARHFPAEGPNGTTKSMDSACKAIYRALGNAGAWGLSALSKLPTSGIDFEHGNPDQIRAINTLPARIYHGVNTDAGVLMRMNFVPRTAAVELGNRFMESGGHQRTSAAARSFVRSLGDNDWQAAAPLRAAMSGSDYRKIWLRLSGEGS